MNFIHEEEKDLKNVFNRFRKRDFSGTGGQIIKNGGYQLGQNLIFKFGSLIFTIILARMLMPNLMGLYTLALATIVLFGSFSDLGIGSALITYGAKTLGRGNLRKTKGYVKKLFKWKILLMIFSSGILLISAYFIAEIYYAKPIFYALLVGGIYLPIISMIGFVEGLFRTTEKFKMPMIKEIIFQITRLILVPLTILFFLNYGLSDRGIIVVTLLAIVVSYFISLLFLIFKGKRIKFLKGKSEDLTQKETKNLKKFIYPLTATAMAGMFFGYIDTLMLGHFVASRFIAYYGAAFSLVGGATAIIGFMASAVMPVFARKSGKVLEKIFKKIRLFTILISLSAGIFTYFISEYFIQIIYGTAYLPAAEILKLFSILIILLPLIGIYDGYFITQKKTKKLAWLIFMAAILNIFFNYFGITWGLQNYGPLGAVFGAVGATIFSRILYFAGLVIFRNK